MKAESYIFSSVQKPSTMFGLPPLAFMAVIFSGFLSLGIAFISGLSGFSLPIAGLGMILAYIPLIRLQRRNHHFMDELLSGSGFWRGRNSRILICGLPTNHKNKARKR